MLSLKPLNKAYLCQENTMTNITAVPLTIRGMNGDLQTVNVCRMDAAYERTWMPCFYFYGQRVTVCR